MYSRLGRNVIGCCSAFSYGGLCIIQYNISKINDQGGISCVQIYRKYKCVCVCIYIYMRIIDVLKHASSITVIECESKTIADQKLCRRWKYQMIVVC